MDSGKGVEKMPYPAKAMKVPTSFMMRSRPAVRMFEPAVRPAMTPWIGMVAGLTVEGHIADATLGLCWRA